MLTDAGARQGESLDAIILTLSTWGDVERFNGNELSWHHNHLVNIGSIKSAYIHNLLMRGCFTEA